MKRLLTILLLSLALQGCYTQLSMFHPEVETDTEEFQPYSVARVRPNLSLYANDGAGQSLGMAYQLMYNRFNGFMDLVTDTVIIIHMVMVDIIMIMLPMM